MRLDLLISHFVGRKEGGDRRKGREGRKEGGRVGGTCRNPALLGTQKKKKMNKKGVVGARGRQIIERQANHFDRRAGEGRFIESIKNSTIDWGAHSPRQPTWHNLRFPNREKERVSIGVLGGKKLCTIVCTCI